MTETDRGGKLEIVCVDFKPLQKNTLRGFATIKIPVLRMVFKDVALHHKGNTRWAALPGKPQLSKDGVAIRGADGKIAYSPVFEFDDRQVRYAFSDAVVRAVEAFAPSAFEAEPVGEQVSSAVPF
jgi:hypothetical protein